MKQLLQLNTTEIIRKYREENVFSLTGPYSSTKKAFIPHLLALFSTIPVVRNDNWKKGTVSMAKTMADIPDQHHTSEGIFSRQEIMNLLWIAAKVPRGKLITGTQVGNPKYAAFTPLFMYAHKRDNGVKYSEWDWEDKRINAALGDFLGVCNDFRKAWPNADLRVNDKQRQALAKGKKYDEWNAYCKMVVMMTVGEDENQHEEQFEVPKELTLLQQQFWIANAGKRDTETMLLDIFNYDRVPPALDVVAPVRKGELEW